MHSTRSATQTAAIPVTVLTGFLGAGKTTLLQRILSDPQGRRLGVLVNDFGAINVDAALIVQSSADQIALSNGCICCTLRDDLVAALERLLSTSPPPQHVVIEASGVSRPVAIVDALDHPSVKDRVALDAVLCVVDSQSFSSLDFASTELAIDQATGSDLVLLNKIDLATPDELAGVARTLRGALPQVRMLPTRYVDVPGDVVFGLRLDATGERDLGPQALDIRSGVAGPANSFESGHGTHAHDEEFESWSWACDIPLDTEAIRTVLRALPEGVLRAKGILRVAHHPGMRGIVQAVGKRRTLEMQEGDPPSGSVMVAVFRKGAVDPDALTRLVESLRPAQGIR